MSKKLVGRLNQENLELALQLYIKLFIKIKTWISLDCKGRKHDYTSVWNKKKGKDILNEMHFRPSPFFFVCVCVLISVLQY